ncbi:MAG: membrane protein insertion efficiency factor YidD [Deltaproteobacteria bacterium]|nr:membrane protein insertion efficiency factor YidD [Deltaproteobacteria bacterium]MBW2323858.1 membrane protein insertion efficiency factor YidD [Deltaproteobacteria bacterium]
MLWSPPELQADGGPRLDERPALTFAQMLFEEGDFFRAIGEAKRFLFFYPQGQDAEMAGEIIRESRKALDQKKKGSKSGKSSLELPVVFQNKNENSPAGGPAIGLIRFYQNHLRSFKTSSCPSYPNCSEYTIQAINRHGVFMGTFIFVDRLFREVTTAQTPPFVRFKGRILHYDPLEANDYWLKGFAKNNP